MAVPHEPGNSEVGTALLSNGLQGRDSELSALHSADCCIQKGAGHDHAKSLDLTLKAVGIPGLVFILLLYIFLALVHFFS